MLVSGAAAGERPISAHHDQEDDCRRLLLARRASASALRRSIICSSSVAKLSHIDARSRSSAAILGIATSST